MDSTSADAARRLASPNVAPTELAAIAAAHPDLRSAVAAHPNCYPDLREWIARVGLPAVPQPPLQVPLAPAPPTRPAPPARRARLPWIVAAVAVVVALTAVGALVRDSVVDSSSGEPASATTPAARPGGSAAEERGFASPEEAVNYFVASVAAGDLAGATAAFAVTSLVEGFSFQASSELLGVVTSYTWLPELPEYRAVNEGLRRGEVARQLCFLVESVAAPHREFIVAQHLGADLTAADLEADLAPEHLSGLSVIRFDDTIGGSRPNNEYLAPLSAAYGADEVREVAVLYGTDDGSMLGGMELLRFGDEWYLWNLTSHVMGVNPGELQPMSEQEYLVNLAYLQR